MKTRIAYECDKCKEVMYNKSEMKKHEKNCQRVVELKKGERK